ncbi:hypothetical protein L207DRAFT_641682 [Hyaloscypha variabilis F]|uniref:Uncharacterized protein n=1 Tax=Hyaloscypha variabilis (strain UAMH 11265 / GT02V1 / F) TaxID=1149755 RepID=A0A2J6QVW7_HYAVF|nr:hypothetical protein L207DRAFT_641682 [Hyaloscypha variabilis F]
MQLTLLSLFSLLNLPLLLASPINNDTTPFSYEQLTFTFAGGPATYTLTFPADGNTYPTNNDLSVNLIAPGTFPAFYECTFYTNTASTLVLTGTSAAGSDIAVGPPQPIAGVACMPTGADGACLPDYVTCEWSGTQGTFQGTCCSGYCAATKCRPTS